MKVCTTCNEEKHVTDFNKHRTGKDGLSSRCKECDREYRRNWLATKDPNYKKSEALKRVYGISWTQYQDLLSAQDHKCAVCEKPASAFKKGLAVDHDHHTGEIRGLLCGSCNRWVIGRHRDGSLFFKAAKYLTKTHTKLFVPDAYKKGVRRKRKPRR